MTRGVAGTLAGHGTESRYVGARCRCDICRAAHTRYQTHYRIRQIHGVPRKVPRIGSARRIQALAAIGWPAKDLGARLGMTASAVHRIYNDDGDMYPSTVLRVTRLYDELSMTPGQSAETRRRALAAGWVPPLAWDDDTIDDPNAKPYRQTRRARQAAEPIVDEVAIARVLDGDRAQLTPEERLVVVERLAGQGISDRRIAERVGVTERTVYRDREANGIRSRWVAA